MRQRKLPELSPVHPALKRFKALKPQTVEEFAAWVAGERERGTGGSTDHKDNTDQHRQARTCRDSQGESVPVCVSPCQSLSSACLAANGALSLLNLACYLLDRQLAAQAKTFEQEGGFTERLYRKRTQARRRK